MPKKHAKELPSILAPRPEPKTLAHYLFEGGIKGRQFTFDRGEWIYHVVEAPILTHAFRLYGEEAMNRLEFLDIGILVEYDSVPEEMHRSVPVEFRYFKKMEILELRDHLGDEEFHPHG